MKSAFVRASIVLFALGGGVAANVLWGGWSRPVPDVSKVARPRSGDQLVAIFLITKTCPAAKREDLRQAFNAGLLALRDSTKAHGLVAHSIGVALTANNEDTRRFISEYAPFDEISVGNGWLNSAAIAYVWRDLQGVGAVPQLILVLRHVRVNPQEMAISPDSVLLRLSGADNILRWAKSRAPFRL